mgnify:CR=1 FL=1
MAYFWPLILVVASNSVYHICAKSLPESVDPLASLTVTSIVAARAGGTAVWRTLVRTLAVGIGTMAVSYVAGLVLF